MEQIKHYWALLQEKMNEDPLIKKAVIFGGIAISAILIMFVIKAFKSTGPSEVTVTDPVAVQSEPTTTVAQPAQAPVAQAVAEPQPAAASTSAQQIVTMAVKPLSALSTMTPGFETSYSYAVGHNIADQSLFAKVSTVAKNIGSFQFLSAIEDEATRAQIIPGDVVLKTETTGYFVVEQQSTPLINVLLSGEDTRVIEVYLDDQVLPVARNALEGGWLQPGQGSASLPIIQPLGQGIHRIKVVSKIKYAKRELKTAVRVSIKREQDQAPVDMQVYRDVPPPVASAPVSQTAVASPEAIQPTTVAK